MVRRPSPWMSFTWYYKNGAFNKYQTGDIHQTRFENRVWKVFSIPIYGDITFTIKWKTATLYKIRAFKKMKLFYFTTTISRQFPCDENFWEIFNAHLYDIFRGKMFLATLLVGLEPTTFSLGSQRAEWDLVSGSRIHCATGAPRSNKLKTVPFMKQLCTDRKLEFIKPIQTNYIDDTSKRKWWKFG